MRVHATQPYIADAYEPGRVAVVEPCTDASVRGLDLGPAELADLVPGGHAVLGLVTPLRGLLGKHDVPGVVMRRMPPAK
jgi:hypothetical protein